MYTNLVNGNWLLLVTRTGPGTKSSGFSIKQCQILMIFLFPASRMNSLILPVVFDECLLLPSPSCCLSVVIFSSCLLGWSSGLFYISFVFTTSLQPKPVLAWYNYYEKTFVFKNLEILIKLAAMPLVLCLLKADILFFCHDSLLPQTRHKRHGAMPQTQFCHHRGKTVETFDLEIHKVNLMPLRLLSFPFFPCFICQHLSQTNYSPHSYCLFKLACTPTTFHKQVPRG